MQITQDEIRAGRKILASGSSRYSKGKRLPMGLWPLAKIRISIGQRCFLTNREVIRLLVG